MPANSNEPNRKGPTVDQLLDADAAAAYLAVTKKYLYRLTSERRVGFVKLGSKLRFKRRDLDAFIEANHTAAM